MPCALDPMCAHACCVECHPPRAAMTSSSHPKPQFSVFLSENFKVHTAVGLGRLAAHISHRMLRGDDVIRSTQKSNHMLSHTLPTCHSNRSPIPCRQVLLPAWPPLDFEIFQPSSARPWGGGTRPPHVPDPLPLARSTSNLDSRSPMCQSTCDSSFSPIRHQGVVQHPFLVRAPGCLRGIHRPPDTVAFDPPLTCTCPAPIDLEL